MTKKTSDVNQAYILKLNDDVRQQLETVKESWYEWIGGKSDQEIAYQLAAYQSLAQLHTGSK